MEQLKQKYEELLFLTETKQEDLAGLTILYVHAMNICKGLKCNGQLEDDPEDEKIIPSNWNTSVQGVYSLRYKNVNNTPIYFKFIAILDQLNINCVMSEQLYSVSFNFKQIDFKNITSNNNQQFFKKYEQEIINKLDLKIKSDTKQSQQSQQYDKDFFWTPVNSNNNNNNNNNSNNSNSNPFGNYGRSDLEPVPFRNDIFQPMNPLQIFSSNTQGNLMGPNNPIFNQPQMNNPHFRYDPIMPNNMGQDPDIDLFQPQNNYDPNILRGNFRPQRGGFGGGLGGGFGNGNRHMFG